MADDWCIRDHAAVLYTALPTKPFLGMNDQMAWISIEPMADDKSQFRMAKPAPKLETIKAKASHWMRKKRSAEAMLVDDYSVNAATQAGIASGANTHLTFGC